jgi:hypothetical protein
MGSGAGVDAERPNAAGAAAAPPPMQPQQPPHPQQPRQQPRPKPQSQPKAQPQLAACNHLYRLFVGWVPKDYTEADLKPLFNQVGTAGICTRPAGHGMRARQREELVARRAGGALAPLHRRVLRALLAVCTRCLPYACTHAPCGLHAASMRPPCGLHAASMRPLCGLHAASMRAPCGLHAGVKIGWGGCMHGVHGARACNRRVAAAAAAR